MDWARARFWPRPRLAAEMIIPTVGGKIARRYRNVQPVIRPITELLLVAVGSRAARYSPDGAALRRPPHRRPGSREALHDSNSVRCGAGNCGLAGTKQ